MACLLLVASTASADRYFKVGCRKSGCWAGTNETGVREVPLPHPDELPPLPGLDDCDVVSYPDPDPGVAIECVFEELP